ncbi:MAG TPA: efflux RND transporter permease subunit, partial [Polyangiaceae bacterium]|nr:efflux RND transporter permease subunit [Polyangiaceae bacterium]
LSAIEGVQRADILGGRTFAMRAWLKPDRMAALNVSPTEVRQALAANNFLTAVGQTKGHYVQVNLSATTDVQSVDGFKRLVIRERNGSLVRLEDIADVSLGADNYDQDVRMSGRQEVFLGVWVLPTANSLDVIARVRKEMDTIKGELPSGMRAAVAFDSTNYIKSAIEEVTRTLIETILIVVVVIYLFLGSLRTVLVPIVAIPLSLVGTIFLMQVFGFTLNLLTLLAVVLAVGLVVDDAIVVVENVERNIREGKTPMEAALQSARGLAGPIVAMTVTLAAVYAPIGFQGGLTGALFKEFAFTRAGAVMLSGIVALTLSPVMSSRLLRENRTPGWLVRSIDRGFEALKSLYERTLSLTLRHRPAVYVVWAVLSLAVIPLYLFSPSELAPNEDQGIAFTALDVPANATIEQLTPYTEQIHAAMASVPEFEQSFQVTFPTQGFGGALMKPWDKRDRTIFAIQEELGKKLQQVAGVRAPVFLPPALPSEGFFPVEFVIASTIDHQQLAGMANRLVEQAAKSGQFAFPPILDVRIDQAGNEIVIDRDKVSSMGLTMQNVGADLSAMLGGNFVNRFSIDGRSYKVIAQMERSGRLTASQLQELHVTGPGGELIPLGSIAYLQESVEPRTLNRFQQLNAIKISGVATQSLDSALKVLEDAAKQVLPPGSRTDYTGASRQLRHESGKFLWAMALSITLIFLALAAQFNSFRDPLVILAGSVPLAMFGALIFTFLKFMGPPGLRFGLTEGWTTTLNIYSQVGLVTLVGLVAKNGILIVDFANKQQAAGYDKLTAVRMAATTRLRPILMTTTATIAGHFPLTLVTGPGAVARNSIGIILVGGMAIGSAFTLFVVPALYVLLAGTHRRELNELSAAEEHPVGYRSDIRELAPQGSSASL